MFSRIKGISKFLIFSLLSGCNRFSPVEPKTMEDKVKADFANGITIQNVFAWKNVDTLVIVNIDSRPVYVYMEPTDCINPCIPTIWRSINEPHYMLWPYTGPRTMNIVVEGPRIYGYPEN